MWSRFTGAARDLRPAASHITDSGNLTTPRPDQAKTTFDLIHRIVGDTVSLPVAFLYRLFTYRRRQHTRRRLYRLCGRDA
jgi:hypothetical protein